MSEQPDVRPDPDAEPSAAVTPGAGEGQGGAEDPGARPVDEDAPEVTQHVGRDESTERAEDADAYDQAADRAGVAGATGIAPPTRRP